MNITAFIQMYNELSKGNLERCLENCILWADNIVIYDDGSDDGSYEFAKKYTKHIIKSDSNNINKELFHKQIMLDYIKQNIKTDWVMWIDCDETLDRNGTDGGLRKLAEKLLDSQIDCVSFHEYNLWRGHNWHRKDSYFNSGYFNRLWKLKPELNFIVKDGVHLQLWPEPIKNFYKSNIEVIHYGFCEYEKLLIKIGVDIIAKERNYDKNWKEVLIEIYEDNWILNESKLDVEEVNFDMFPENSQPILITDKPFPIKYETQKDVKKYSFSYNIKKKQS
jgi:hypothetical protein